MPIRIPTLAAALLFLGGFLAAARAQQPVPSSFFDYNNHAALNATSRLIGTQDGIQEFLVTYPSPVMTGLAVNDTVTAYLFLPPGPGPHPAMIVMHEWLPRNLNVEIRMSRSMAAQGVAAFLMVAPYSLNRRPHPRVPGAELITSDVPHMVGALRQAVLDARRGFDWLSSQPEIDPLRMGVSGISLGGILAAVIAGADQRAKVLFTIDAGGDVSTIFRRSPIMSGLRRGLRREGWTEQSLAQSLMPLEPTGLLKGLAPQNALFINGRYDIIVRPWQAKDLARSLGGSKIVWVNAGHYGVGLSEDPIKQVGAQFLRARFFGEDTGELPSTLRSYTIKGGLLFGGQEGVSPVLAYQMIDFDEEGRFSLDSQLTTHGLSAALSARLSNSTSLGVEFPLLHGTTRPRPFMMFSLTL